MDRRDRGLELIRADRRLGQGRADQRDPLLDGGRSQSASILLGERNQGAVVADTRRPAGIGEEHQGEQPGDLTVLGQQAPQLARQPDRLRAQFDPLERRTRARGVALVEDQVQDVEHGAEPVAPFRGRGHPELGAAFADPLLRPADPLGHRRLGHQERAGDLRGRQPADGSQRQCHLRRGVSDGWQHRNTSVSVSSRVGPGSGSPSSRPAAASSRRRRAVSLRCCSIQRRDATRTSQPVGLAGTPSAGHWQRRRDECLLDGVLAGVEVP